ETSNMFPRPSVSADKWRRGRTKAPGVRLLGRVAFMIAWSESFFQCSKSRVDSVDLAHWPPCFKAVSIAATFMAAASTSTLAAVNAFRAYQPRQRQQGG